MKRADKVVHFITQYQSAIIIGSPCSLIIFSNSFLASAQMFKLFFYFSTKEELVVWIVGHKNTPACFCSASGEYSSTFDLVIKRQNGPSTADVIQQWGWRRSEDYSAGFFLKKIQSKSDEACGCKYPACTLLFSPWLSIRVPLCNSFHRESITCFCRRIFFFFIM